MAAYDEWLNDKMLAGSHLVLGLADALTSRRLELVKLKAQLLLRAVFLYLQISPLPRK